MNPRVKHAASDMVAAFACLGLLFAQRAARDRPRAVRLSAGGRTAEHQPVVVTLKLAMDRQGAVDDLSNSSYRFTSPESLDAVHRLRRASDAVLVGVNTVIRDDPSLTVRRVPLMPGCAQPLRVVLDRRRDTSVGARCDPIVSHARAARRRRLSTPLSSKLLNDGFRTLVVASADADVDAAVAARFESALADGPASLVRLASPNAADEPPGPALHDVLRALEDRGVRQLMVEGGPETARRFLRAGLVDRAIIVTAPVTFEIPVLSGIGEVRSRAPRARVCCALAVSSGVRVARAQVELQAAGLARHVDHQYGGNDVQCWSRPSLPWPPNEVPDVIWP